MNSTTVITSIHDTAANLLLAGNAAAVGSAPAVLVTDAFVSAANATSLHALNATAVIASIHDTAANLLLAGNAAAVASAPAVTATDAFVAAFGSAATARQPEIVALAADSYERIAAAAGMLAEERGRLDEGDARTVAGYIAARYANAGSTTPLANPTD